jgi:succinate-semialdehyde dehydrogenase/glutarate-semialdehyde dehydrogenase
LAKEKIAAYKIGNPLESDVFIGPIARKDLQEKLQLQVQQCLAGGATLFWQQDHIPSTGYFFPPSILCQIPVDNLAAQEELFGPVLSVFEYSSEEELITIANSTQYGLGASIFTSNLGRAERLANQIESGMVYINQMVKSDPRIPFGGIKKSGFGRELGPEGLLAFCQTKTTWVKQK